MRTFTFLLLFFHASNCLLCQSSEIELAISYDANYAASINQDVLNPFNSVEDRINAVVSGINAVYSNYDVNFTLVAVEQFGTTNLSGGVNATGAMTQAWITKDGTCYERDLVLHLTGSDLSSSNVLGESQFDQLGKLCRSNNFDFGNGFNEFVVVTKFQSLWQEIKTAAHELGHALRLTHESENTCTSLPLNTNSHYFMCQGSGGASPGPAVNFIVSPPLENNLNTSLNKPCVNSQDHVTTTCTDFIAEFLGNTEIFEQCNDPDPELYTLFIKNNQDSRSFSNPQITFNGLDTPSSFAQLGITTFIINGVTVQLSTLNSSYQSLQKQHIISLPPFSLTPNEEFIVSFAMDYANSSAINLNEPALAYFLFSSIISPGILLSGNTTLARSILPESRSLNIPDGSTTAGLNAAILNLQSNNNYPIDQLELIIEGSLIVDQDLTIDEHCILKMQAGASIDVVNQSQLTIKNTAIIPCDNARWDEINISSGSKIDFYNVYIHKSTNGINAIKTSNAKSDIKVEKCIIDDCLQNGITIKAYSSSSISNNVISTTGFYGINIEGDVRINNFNGNQVANSYYGVRILDNPYLTQIDQLSVGDAIAGLMLIRSSAIVDGGTFSDNALSIYLAESDASAILNNTIGYDYVGITMENTTGVSIINNEIGTTSDYGKVAISMKNIKYTVIRNNPSIVATTYGIRGMQTYDVDIYRNANIFVTGVQDIASGAISMTTAAESDIWDNFIYASRVAYGIETNNSYLNEIYDNFVSVSPIPNLFRSAAIRTMGSLGEEIINNETYSFLSGNGIEVQNSVDGRYECNLINDTYDGMSIEHNSESQHLQTNHYINSSNFDFLTRSRLGLQENEGNEFWQGSVRGYFNTIEDRDASLFFVDDNDTYHMPSDPTPANNEWFVPNNNLDEQCSLGNVGPSFQTTFFGDQVKSCAYWNDVKSLQATDPNMFVVKVLHIIKYFKVRPWLTMPNCIKFDTVYTSLCGTEDVVDALDEIIKSSQVSSTRASLETAIQDILTLHDEYSVVSDVIEKADKLNDIDVAVQASRPDFIAETSDDNVILADIRTDLMQLSCSDILMQMVKDGLLEYIDELEIEGIDQSNRATATVLSTSNECSDQYGDIVHLSRSIASYQGSDIYFDVNDGCKDTGSSIRRTNNAKDLSMTVFPNPSLGRITIDFNSTISGEITIYNLMGVEISKRTLDNIDTKNIQIDTPGVYLLSYVSDTGLEISKKLIVTN